MCTMEIDATSEAAHITFIDKDNNLGVMYPGYELGQPIRVDKGDNITLTVYNGKIAGPLRFTMIASSAVRLAIGSVLATAAVLVMS